MKTTLIIFLILLIPIFAFRENFSKNQVVNQIEDVLNSLNFTRNGRIENSEFYLRPSTNTAQERGPEIPSVDVKLTRSQFGLSITIHKSFREFSLRHYLSCDYLMRGQIIEFSMFIFGVDVKLKNQSDFFNLLNGLLR